jgi:hypothetical protein
MAKYRLYKNTNVKSAGYNKYYAHKSAGKLIGLNELIAHMAGHNTAFSKGVIRVYRGDRPHDTRNSSFVNNLGEFLR